MSRGFTLIEVMVVIAIVAVLAAILFPAFARAREQGRKVVCASNLRQIGLAIHMYTDDWDGFFPTPPEALPVQCKCCWGQARFTDTLQPYLRNDQVPWCPSETVAKRYHYAGWRIGGDTHTSYSYAQCFYKPTSFVRYGQELPFGCPVVGHCWSEVTYPSKKIISWERQINHNPGLMGRDPLRWDRWWWQWEGNNLFVDGHVKYMRRSQMLKSYVIPDHRPDPAWTIGGVGGKDIP